MRLLAALSAVNLALYLNDRDRLVSLVVAGLGVAAIAVPPLVIKTVCAWDDRKAEKRIAQYEADADAAIREAAEEFIGDVEEFLRLEAVFALPCAGEDS